MAISFSVSFNSVANLVYSLNSGTVRVAATAAGSSGQLASTSGVTGASSVNWSLQGAPVWLTINSSGVVNFSGVDVAKIGLYNFAIVATDASNPSNQGLTAVSIEVLPNLTLKESGGLTTIAITSLNASVSNMLEAMGADGITQLSSVEYQVVGSLPTGLSLRTDADAARLYGTLKSLSDVRGGVKTVGSGQAVQIKAWKAGTFYDHPDRATILNLTYNVTAASAGDLDIAVSGYVDSSGSPFIRLHARGDVKTGSGDITSGTSYAWSASGTATGTFLDSHNTDTTTWAPTATGQVTFNLTISTTGTITSSYNAGSVTLDIATGTVWTSSGKLKLIPSDPTKMETQGESSAVTTFGVKITDVQSGQTATISATATPVGTAPSASSPSVSIVTYTDVNSTNGDVSNISFTVPSGAVIGDKYLISVSASGSGRTGTLQYYVVCSGATHFTITPSSTSVALNTSATYTSGSPLFTISSAQSGVTYNLVNAPPGLYVDGSNNVVGKAQKGQVGTLKIYAAKATFSSFDTTTVNFTVTEDQGLVSPALSTPTPVISPGSNLTLNWGWSGTASNWYIQKNNEAPVSLSGSVNTYTYNNLTVNSSISLKGTNNVGEFFAVPIEVLVSSTGTVTRLPQSPTIAEYLQDGTINVNWSPIPLGSDSAHYFDKYSNWNLIYKINSGSEVLVPGSPVTGLSSGGTLPARVLSFGITPAPASTDVVYLDMQAFSSDPTNVLDSFRWDKSDNNPPFNMKAFPTFGVVNIDKDTAAKNEPIKVTISGFDGDKWRIVFQDGTATPFLPISVTSTAISFSTGGVNQNLTIQVENDYSSSLPSVKLRSSGSKNVFIVDQDYVAPGTTDPLGNVGFGGDSGFELTDNTTGQAVLQPYISIVKALVKDEVTNELKLMVATTRTADGSSILGTMAVDVFPVLGRPHLKDLIKPTASPVYSSTIQAPVQITTEILPDIIIGQFTEIKLIAAGGTAPYSWYSDSLPFGLSLSADGTLYGSVLTLGASKISISAMDSSNPAFIDEKTFDVVVKSDLKITTTTLPNATVITLYNQQLSLTGGVGPYQWALVGGELPIGLSVNQATGVIEGSAASYNSTTDFSKTYTFVVQVADSVGALASKQFNIGLNPTQLTISDMDQKTIYKGEKNRLIAGIYGGTAPYTNLSITDVNGILSTSNSRIRNGFIEFDVPETVNSGNYSISVSVTDANTTVATKTLIYSVGASLGQFRIVDSMFDNFYDTVENGNHYVTCTTVGGATATFSTTSPLADGAIVSYNDTTKQINVKGPVTAGSNVEFDAAFSITGTTADGLVKRTYSILGHTGAFTTVSPGVMNISTKPYEVGDFVFLDPQRPYFNSTSTSRNSLWITRVQPGQALPKGLSLDAVTGLIYGTVLANDVTTTVIEYVLSTGEVVGTLNVGFTLTQKAEIPLDTSALGTATRGTAYTGSIVGLAPAVGPLSLVVKKGTLPPGITYSVTGNTINFSGTPTTGGFYDVWLEIADSSSPATKKTLLFKRFEVSYSSILRITTDVLPLVIAGVPYTSSVAAAGGVTPYSFSLAPGSPALPSGISISSGGVFSGSTTDVNYSQTVVIRVTDSNSNIFDKTFILRVDSGYALSSAFGSNNLGKWAKKQPDLANVGNINYGSVTPFGAFVVRVAGLEATNSLSGTMPTIALGDPELVGTWFLLQTEGPDIVGYFRITNVSRTSPESRSISLGNKSLSVTVSNGSGRVKNVTLNYDVIDSTGSVYLIGGDLSSVNMSSVGFVEGPGTSLYLTDGSVDVGTNTPYLKIAGLDLVATPIDPVANNLIRVVSIDSSMSGNFGLTYVGSTSTGGAIVQLSFIGNRWGSPVSGATMDVRVADVAGMTLISGTSYKIDAFTKAPLTPAFYRDANATINELVKAGIQSSTSSLYLNEPYVFQVNFDEPLHPSQSPSVTVTGLVGGGSPTFVLDAQGRKTGFKITGLWPKNPSETYPKNYTINAQMTETNSFVIGGHVNPTGTINHFNTNLVLNVSEDTAGLKVEFRQGDTSTLSPIGTNLYPYGVSSPSKMGTMPANPWPGLFLKNAAGGSYLVKVFGDSGNTPYGNSKNNLPNKIYLQNVNNVLNFYSTNAIATANVGSGMSMTTVPAGADIKLANFGWDWMAMYPTNNVGAQGYMPFPEPAVNTSVDYSTPANIIANATTIQTFTTNVNIQVTEVATGAIANAVGALVSKPNFNSDWSKNGIVVLQHFPSGSTGVPDTFKVLGWYYDKANPTEYNLASFPDDGSIQYNLNAGTTYNIYVIAAIPYLLNRYEDFTYVTTPTNTGFTVTKTTSSSDAVISKAVAKGVNIQVESLVTSTNYATWPFLGWEYNSYTVVAAASTSNAVLQIQCYTGVTDVPYTDSWNGWTDSIVTRKVGRMKFKPINITLHGSAGGPGGGGGGCVDLNALIRMGDGSTKAAKFVRTGDQVLTFNPLTGINEAKTVIDVFRHGVKPTVMVFHSGKLAVMSKTHRVYVLDDRCYYEAKNLKTGMVIQSENGPSVINNIIENYDEREVMTYTVQDNHNYYADGILAHNMKPADCTPAGSKVSMADGSKKNIEELVPGDLVVSYNVETGEFEANKFLSTFKTSNPDRLKFSFEDGSSAICSLTHLFFFNEDFVTAKDLHEVFEFKSKDGQQAVEVRLAKMVDDHIEEVLVTDIEEIVDEQDPWLYLGEVENNHTLVVDDLIVHNYKTPYL